MNVPFLTLESQQKKIRSEVVQKFTQVYDKGNYIMGEELTTFELSYAQFSGTNYCIGVGNGYDALKISLLALDIKEGDEVILPAYSFYATLLSILEVKAIPVFVDIDKKDGLMDLHQLESKMTSKTKAIIAVHLYGHMVNMDQLIDVVNKHQLYLIEDNAQAQGAEWRNKRSGSFGHVNATSFYPGKNLGALGDAGAITTNDEDLYKKCLSIRNYGSTVKYVHNTVGVNSRLDELQAGFLNIKLKYLEKWNLERQNIVDMYSELLKNVRDIFHFRTKDVCLPANHLFTIHTKKREKLKEFLKEKGVDTLIHYPIPLHLQEGVNYLGYKKGDFPIAEEIASTTLSLPLFIGMTNEQVKYVCDQIKLFFDVAD
ncbi:DegT/DnrJ/EryC1/StrS family aminotransferase [Flammeovirga sp. MY04]|uniref:DegT/DnrJ/EryC1/StrS family aminotransferase n=1 Tax=Flammeovirga sp. MY04 TaxID=1191459 RepID=UPI00080616F9|nr:DegT/DnrJ/EryC1/StrS family aminotransferase [Flammeovirga sp. MY04]ANQ49503.1 DegT/DnrJ/EryC1/StrS family aminotransferase [Flammeovirga sp. MY04]